MHAPADRRLATMRSRLREPVRRLVDRLFPRTCALCSAVGVALCEPCRGDAARGLETACLRCAIPLPRGAASLECGRCLARSPHYDATIAAALYEPPFDQLVRGLKYGATLSYAPLFAELLATRLTTRDRDAIELVVPIPLSRARTAERGFNQAIEIARPLARSLGKPLRVDALLRIVDTAPQASLPFDERRRNMRGAFTVVDVRRVELAGRCVAVVDDVMTTGATLDECARTLKRAGAARIVNLVAARTP